MIDVHAVEYRSLSSPQITSSLPLEFSPTPSPSANMSLGPAGASLDPEQTGNFEDVRSLLFEAMIAAVLTGD